MRFLCSLTVLACFGTAQRLFAQDVFEGIPVEPRPSEYNSLLSCIYTGLMMGPGLINYSKNLTRHYEDVPATAFSQARLNWEGRFQAIKKMNGKDRDRPFLIGPCPARAW